MPVMYVFGSRVFHVVPGVFLVTFLPVQKSNMGRCTEANGEVRQEMGRGCGVGGVGGFELGEVLPY